MGKITAEGYERNVQQKFTPFSHFLSWNKCPALE